MTNLKGWIYWTKLSASPPPSFGPSAEPHRVLGVGSRSNQSAISSVIGSISWITNAVITNRRRTFFGSFATVKWAYTVCVTVTESSGQGRASGKSEGVFICTCIARYSSVTIDCIDLGFHRYVSPLRALLLYLLMTVLRPQEIPIKIIVRI